MLRPWRPSVAGRSAPPFQSLSLDPGHGTSPRAERPGDAVRDAAAWTGRRRGAVQPARSAPFVYLGPAGRWRRPEHRAEAGRARLGADDGALTTAAASLPSSRPPTSCTSHTPR